MDVKDTAKANTEDIEKVYLFSGEVDSRRQSAVDELVTKVVDADYATFDRQEFDGNTAAAESIISAIAIVPIASERRVVIVDRVDLLDADGQVRLAGFIPKLGLQSCLILLVSEDASRQRKPSKVPKEQADDEEAERQKRKKGLQPELVAAAKKHGTVTNFAKLRSNTLTGLITKAVKAHGKKIQPPAVQALARSVEANLAIAEREIEKLVAYTADRDTITMGDVDKVACKSPEDRVFPLIDAIAARNSGRAIQLLNETLAASTNPDSDVLRILALIGKHFRLLCQAKFLKTQGVRNLGSVPEDLAPALLQEHRQNPVSLLDWQQKKLLEQTNAFTSDELRSCLQQVLSCELTLKGIGRGQSTPRLSLEMLVLRLSQRRERSRT